MSNGFGPTLPDRMAAPDWDGMARILPRAPHAHERREWNAALEKEWRDAESRYKQLTDSRGQYFDAVCKQIEGLIAAGGPAMLLHSATKVRELLRPLDPTASAK